MQRTRDRRGGERQHVHAQLQRLEPLLVPHPEAMLFIHDEQAEILEGDVPGQQPVRPDDDVYLSCDETLRHARGLFGRAEPRQHLDAHRIVRQPLPEGAAVLLGENRSRDQHGGLLPRLYRLERRADRDLRLSVPHVADQQPVHGAGALHVALDVHRRPPLVGGVFIKEGGLELGLPRRVGRERVPGRDLAAGVEVQQVQRHLPDRGLRLGALPLPGG